MCESLRSVICWYCVAPSPAERVNLRCLTVPFKGLALERRDSLAIPQPETELVHARGLLIGSLEEKVMMKGWHRPDLYFDSI